MKTNPFKNFVSILMVAIMALSVSSCEPDKLMTFEDGRADVYFLWPSHVNPAWFGGADTYRGHRPFLESKFEILDPQIFAMELDIPIRVMGAVTDYDRPVAVRVINELFEGYHPFIYTADSLTNAIEGIHYESITGVIPAGSATGRIRIVTTRPPAEHSKQVILSIQLIPNDHFGTTFDSVMFNVSRGWSRPLLNYRVFISNTLTMPAMWTEELGREQFGYFSVNKYLLLIEVTGFPAAFWERRMEIDGRILSPPITVAAGAMLRYHLYERWVKVSNGEFDENGVPYDFFRNEDGTRMIVPGLMDMVGGG
jgi:hypothetical protein